MIEKIIYFVLLVVIFVIFYLLSSNKVAARENLKRMAFGQEELLDTGPISKKQKIFIWSILAIFFLVISFFIILPVGSILYLWFLQP